MPLLSENGKEKEYARQMNKWSKEYCEHLSILQQLKTVLENICREETLPGTKYEYRVFYEENDILSEGGGFTSEKDAWLAAAEDKADYCWYNATVEVTPVVDEI